MDGTREPGRVLRGTAAHMARVQEKRAERDAPRDERLPKAGDFILKHKGHLAVPSWRKGA